MYDEAKLVSLIATAKRAGANAKEISNQLMTTAYRTKLGRRFNFENTSNFIRTRKEKIAAEMAGQKTTQGNVAQDNTSTLLASDDFIVARAVINSNLSNDKKKRVLKEIFV